MIVKTCKKHGDLTQEELKCGIYKNKAYRKCKYCELERSRKYLQKKYQDEEWVANKHERDKLRWETKKEEITKKRQDPIKLEKRRNSYHLNADKYREQYKNKQKEYRESLSDTYIKKIIQNGDKSLKFSAIPDSLVQLKKAIVLSRRSIKNMKITLKMEKQNEV